MAGDGRSSSTAGSFAPLGSHGAWHRHGEQRAGRRARGTSKERLGQLSVHKRGAATSRGCGTHGNNGGSAAGAWRTRRHSIEHVSCSDMGKVGRQFGLALGRIRPRTKNKVFSPQPALQLSLRPFCH
jgi:hypothetical protein